MISKLYRIDEVFTVPEILTTTVVYGYQSGIFSFPVTIPDNERLAQFFKPSRGTRYRAYLVNTKGRGLVIKLNEDKILL